MKQRTICLLLIELFVLLATASSQSALLSYSANPGPAGSYLCCTAVDNAGNLLLIYYSENYTGTNSTPSSYSVAVTKLDSSFHLAAGISATLPFFPLASATDSHGNVWLAGPQTLVRLASSNSPALSIDLGGVGDGYTWGGEITFDESDNVYVAGTTTQADFPVTAGAVQGDPGIPLTPGQRLGSTSGFVSKYSSDGTRMASTLLGGVTGTDGIALVSTTPSAIAVDAGGLVTITGTTNATDYPVTPNALQPICACDDFSVFVTRLSPDFKSLVLSTFLGGIGGDRIVGAIASSLALEPDGSVVVAGSTYDTNLPTTSGVIEPALPAGAPSGNMHGFVSRINSSGTALVFSTYLAGSGNDAIYGVQTDSKGGIWIAGNTGSPDFPAPAGSLQLGADFVVDLASDGSHFNVSEHLPAGTTAFGLLSNSDGTLTVIGSPFLPLTSLLRLPAGPVQGMSILGVADSAASQTAGTVAPGEFLSLYGTGLGPSVGLGAALNSSGAVGSKLGGVTVLFDGQQAPLLWVSANQINLLAPYEIANRAVTTLQVVTADGSSQTLDLTVVPAQPNIFVVVNADGTVNGPDHPGVLGSVLTMYASGAGMLSQSLPDGSVAGNPAPTPTTPVLVILGAGLCSDMGEALYAGGSPGLVVNALQIAFQLQLPQPAKVYGPFAPTPCGNSLSVYIGTFQTTFYYFSPSYPLYY